jgi:hypothetical protein
MMIIGILYFNVPWYKIRNFFSRAKKRIVPDELTFIRKYEEGRLDGGFHSDTDYGSTTKYAYESINKIINRFKREDSPTYNVTIENKFNGKFYPIFDLDKEEHLELFKKLYTDTPYVIFISSFKKPDNTLISSGVTYSTQVDLDREHHWAILDVPYDKQKDILSDHNWKICNDKRYVSYCIERKSIVIRGIYENKSRKPQLNETNGNLSKNFQLFIDKIHKYYSNEGLELSVLRYKNHDMLLTFNRKQKLKNINNECN